MGLEESREVKWAATGKGENSEESFESSSSISSSDLTDDASSSSSSSSLSSSNSCGPLHGLAHELMAQLPIKKGLSKYYHGKSQTFASLESVRNVEDLAKKKSSYSRRMKSCKSFGANLNRHKFRPKAIIAKKASPKGSLSPSLTTKDTRMVVN